MSWEIPLIDVVVDAEDLAAVADCLRSGWLTMGPRTQAFEQAVAAATGLPHAVAVSSGTAALHLACAALDIGPGDEVIVPAFASVATANAPRYRGATPVLCDVLSPRVPNIDPDDVERKLTRRTRAIIAVHTFGYPADLAALRRFGLPVIEDAAHGFGAANLGESDLTCLSFCAKAQLALGEGGMVLTRDPELAQRVRLLRSHAMTSGTWDRHRGHAASYDVVDIGFNFRLDEPRAALGLSRLPKLRREIEHRRRIVRAYRERLDNPLFDDVEGSAHFAFGVLFDDARTRATVCRALAGARIQTTRYPALSDDTGLPNAAQAGARHLALPLSARTTLEQVETVSRAVIAALA